jgi:hypothetical protein
MNIKWIIFLVVICSYFAQDNISIMPRENEYSLTGGSLNSKWCWQPCYCAHPGLRRYGTFPLCWCWYPCFCWYYGPQFYSSELGLRADSGMGGGAEEATPPMPSASAPSGPASFNSGTEASASADASASASTRSHS